MGAALVRLKNRAEFVAAARHGAKSVTPGLILQARQHDETERSVLPPLRVGFTVSRKVGGAVQRNRARRRLKAAAGQVIPQCAAEHRDYVVIGRAATVERPFAALVGDLERALKKLDAYRAMSAAGTKDGEERRTPCA